MRIFFPLRLPFIGILLVLIAILTPQHVNADSNSMDPVEQELEEGKSACEQTDTSEYFTCIGTYNEKLKKRDVITMKDLEACAATRKDCLQKCNNYKKRNVACDINACPICPTVQLVEGQRKIIVEGEDKAYKYEMPIMPGQNITTIIKLTNVINNTNVVDIPTNINSTNVNNIYIYNNETSETGGDYGLGYTKTGSCCLAVQPRTCRTTSAGIRCHHKRHKTCGPQCTSRIIHVQNRQRCSRSTGCQQRIGYVPQPRHPRCVYTPEWPHVSCGGNYQQDCDGCYDHYGYGAANYYSGGRHPRHCTGCYDDAFDMGPRYRRGPVFQPFHYHQPPCYLTGMCGMPMCNYYGCFGNEYIDPAFGYPMYGSAQYAYPYQNEFYDDLEFTNEIEKSEQNQSNPIENDIRESWGVEVYKCKVVGDDGAIQIRNCTSDELKGNPFAASPSDYVYYPPQPNESPDYLLDPLSNAVPYAKRSPEKGYHYANLRQDSIFDDYMSDEDAYERPRRKAIHRSRKNSHKKRRAQIVYDDEGASSQ